MAVGRKSTALIVCHATKDSKNHKLETCLSHYSPSKRYTKVSVPTDEDYQRVIKKRFINLALILAKVAAGLKFDYFS